MHEEEEEIELDDFLEADDRLATDGAFTLEEIAEEVLRREDPEDEEDNEPIIEGRVVSFEEAQRGLIAVREYLVKNSGKTGVMKACDLLDDEIQEIRRKKQR